ncbi:hypothetical protein BESB_022840 [Besnoitia besnoiti]|uniref:Uncharacterized protein n=1 Tax=Besnoitia besnoiti TaxID=94643 RepID=A0A2A9M8S3_BESBE|nr:hypothetical protein BESB_022840 [Besnoitia besnoiti]PFH31792.1 hypothetical protein BESB_022840 [Besnoitia besnoiti]
MSAVVVSNPLTPFVSPVTNLPHNGFAGYHKLMESYKRFQEGGLEFADEARMLINSIAHYLENGRLPLTNMDLGATAGGSLRTAADRAARSLPVGESPADEVAASTVTSPALSSASGDARVLLAPCINMFGLPGEGKVSSFRRRATKGKIATICNILRKRCAALQGASHDHMGGARQPPSESPPAANTRDGHAHEETVAHPIAQMEPSAAPRELQATYADVLLRPGPSVGRVSGWAQAYDMRGPQPGSVTNFGEWYPITYPYGWPPYGSPIATGALYLPQTGLGFRRLATERQSLGRRLG